MKCAFPCCIEKNSVTGDLVMFPQLRLCQCSADTPEIGLALITAVNIFILTLKLIVKNKKKNLF